MALLRRVVAFAKGNEAHANLPTGRRVVPFYGCGCAVIGRNGVVCLNPLLSLRPIRRTLSAYLRGLQTRGRCTSGRTS